MKIATVGVAIATILGGISVQAAILSPYTADANTLHLYHFDEAAPPIADFGVAATLRPLDSTVNFPASVASLSGFGSAVSYTANGQETRNLTGTLQNEWQGASGAFTYEAMINVSTALTGNNATQTILARDHTSGGPNQRSFILRLNGANIEFINTGAAGNQTLSKAYPTFGADAFALNNWYHLAVTYNGAENTADNFSFYWTKVSPTVTAATLLGTGQLTLDVGNVGGVSPFTVGNRDAQTGNNSNFRGLIDEVRISDVALPGAAFVPEPATITVVGLAGLGMLGRRRTVAR